MKHYNRLIQIVWLLAALGLGAAAAMMQGPLDRMSLDYGLVAPGNVVMENHPAFVLLQVAPGGLRAPLICYLWIRADKLKDEGQYQEAMQLSEMICRLEPRCPGVWDFHAWNMAWNISVTAQTPEDRWLWVTNGIRLLRDSGIPLNPRSLMLYKNLGWIFSAKMGGNTDDMHMSYKRRWAGEMQHLLGAPPLGDTSEVIKAFEPVAQAPLDKAPGRQGRDMIQRDRLAWMIDPAAGTQDTQAAKYYDPQAAQYASMLAGQGIGIDRGLLEAYNRFSRDEAVEVTRLWPPKLENGGDKRISSLINDPMFALARGKLLAFVRAQLLWNQYKMDPDWMLRLMKEYGPLDWRLVQPHGLYWVSYGLEMCKGDVAATDIDSLNADRTAQNCLKDLTWEGRLSYMENPNSPEMPDINMWADWRFIETTLKYYDLWIKLVVQAQKGQFDENSFRSGHINYMIAVIQMLYVMDRHEKAQQLFDELKKDYKLTGDPYDKDLQDFVIAEINQNIPPSPELARQQYTAALVTSFSRLGRRDAKGGRAFYRYAQLVYNKWQEDAVKRLKAEPFEVVTARIAADMLVKPSIHGVAMDLEARSTLYGQLDVGTRRIIYDFVSPFLSSQCQEAGLNFDKAFPEPSHMAEFRDEIRKQRSNMRPE